MSKPDEDNTDERVPNKAATAWRLRKLRPIGISISRIGPLFPSPRVYYSAMLGIAVAATPLILFLGERWVLSLQQPGLEAKIMEVIVTLVPTFVLPLAAIVAWWASRSLWGTYWSTTWERRALALLSAYEPFDRVEFQLLQARLKPRGPLNPVYFRLWYSREKRAIRTGERTVASGRQAEFLSGRA